MVEDVHLVQYNSSAVQLSGSLLLSLLLEYLSPTTAITITSADAATNTTITTTTPGLLYAAPDICTSYHFDITANNRVGKGDSVSNQQDYLQMVWIKLYFTRHYTHTTAMNSVIVVPVTSEM